jgi:hypothetical protein
LKHFCNVRNTILYIQDIEIIKTIEEITMKKAKTVADLVAVVGICIEASET